MFFGCNASFVAYALLSTFATITEKERDAVQFIIELISCYDRVTEKLRMTFDAHVLAQIYLAELRVMAGRHSYIHEGSLEEAPQARALLNVVVMPLIRHLSDEEYGDLLGSMQEAYFLLSRPLDILEKQVIRWRIRNMNIATDWRSYPVGDLDNYEFGAELPGKLPLGYLLTPLPYPTKPTTTTEEYADEQSEVDLAEYRGHLIDSNESRARPRSECAKELKLKGKAKPHSSIFTIPLLGRSRGSSESRSEYSYNSSSSDTSWVFANEGVERGFQVLRNDEEMIHPMSTPNSRGGQDANAKHSKRKRFSHYVKMLFGHS